jgi:hypothetical protein
MAQRLAEALAQDPRVAELGLGVVMTTDGANISGEVTTELRRQAVCTVAAEILPGITVKNDVTVVVDSGRPLVERVQ